MRNNSKKGYNSTIEQRVTDTLRKAIIHGEFKEGDRLIQEEWAKKLGVSRMPVREALKQLEMEGLVQIEPRRGAVVYPMTTDDIDEIYTLRSFNESIAVVKALPYITEEDLHELKKILLRMETMELNEDNMEEYVLLNKQFHEKMREKCPWRRVKQKVDLLWSGFLPIASPRLLKDYYAQAQKEHRLIYEAIKKKDQELVKLSLEMHIKRNKTSLIEVLAKQYNPVEL